LPTRRSSDLAAAPPRAITAAPGRRDEFDRASCPKTHVRAYRPGFHHLFFEHRWQPLAGCRTPAHAIAHADYPAHTSRPYRLSVLAGHASCPTALAPGLR